MKRAVVDHVVTDDGAGFECIIYRCKKHPDQTWLEYEPGCPAREQEWHDENDCPLCGGTGSLPAQEDVREQRENGIELELTECPACNGTGHKEREKDQ